MNLDLADYNTSSTASGPFGYGRPLSPNLTAQAFGNPTMVIMTVETES